MSGLAVGRCGVAVGRRGFSARSLLAIAVLFGERIHSVGWFGAFLFTVNAFRRLSGLIRMLTLARVVAWCFIAHQLVCWIIAARLCTDYAPQCTVPWQGAAPNWQTPSLSRQSVTFPLLWANSWRCWVRAGTGRACLIVREWWRKVRLFRQVRAGW